MSTYQTIVYLKTIVKVTKIDKYITRLKGSKKCLFLLKTSLYANIELKKGRSWYSARRGNVGLECENSNHLSDLNRIFRVYL